MCSPYLVLWNVNREMFVPKPHVRLANKYLQLIGIVLLLGGHYVAKIRISKRMWVFYDDVAKPTTCELGTFQQMLQHNPKPEQFGFLHFYSSESSL